MFSEVILLGRLTRDPELRVSRKGSDFCAFSLAVNNYIYDKSTNDYREEACYIDCIAFSRNALSIAERAPKGTLLFVIGSLTQDEWKDKETGKTRRKHKILVSRVRFVLPKDRQPPPTPYNWDNTND